MLFICSTFCKAVLLYRSRRINIVKYEYFMIAMVCYNKGTYVNVIITKCL